jgi:Histidine phosphatase superfamily (branch 1)
MTDMSEQIIHLFRHAQALHNSENNTSLRDPQLTANGITQAEQILTTYQFFNRPTLILVSPLQRAIQTALHAFHPSFNKSAVKLSQSGQPPRFLALPHLQEVTEKPCDTGTSLAFLKKSYGQFIEFPDDLFHSDIWFVKHGTVFADENALLSNRAKFVRAYIKQCGSEEIIVMTHGDFSHFLVNEWLYGPGCGTLFNGLKQAAGLPMALRAINFDGSEYGLRKEIPAWFGRQVQESQGNDGSI